MTAIVVTPGALEDLERIRDFLLRHDADRAEERIEDLFAAIEVLTHAPEIGRRVAAGSRELVIGKGARGHVARYRYLPAIDTAFVLALRHQREHRDRG